MMKIYNILLLEIQFFLSDDSKILKISGVVKDIEVTSSGD